MCFIFIVFGKNSHIFDVRTLLNSEMYKHIQALLLFLFSMHLLCAKPQPTESAKVGLVLSGGGAKGFAHIGVLKVLQEANISIDMIGGTSVGSIVGAFYALGYSATEIETMILDLDWDYMLSDKVDRKYNPYFEKEEQDRYSVSFPITPKGVALPTAITKGQNILSFFTHTTSDYHNITDFSKLPIPFFCIASDINSGEEVLLDHGYLPWCIKASMAVPMAFDAQEIDGRQLVDGGVLNNFPVDVMRSKGADFIIGVDITDGLNDTTKSMDMGDMAARLIGFFGRDKFIKNIEDCNIYIRPDITGYTGGSFSREAAVVLIKRGETAARSMLPELIALRDSLNAEPSTVIVKRGISNGDNFRVADIEFHGIKNTNMSYILGKMHLSKGDTLNISKLEEGIDRVYGTKQFDFVTYRIEDREGIDKKLHLYVNEAYTDGYNIGFHYDNVDDASLLLNGTWRNYFTGGSRLSLNLKLATNISAYSQYTVDRGARPGYSFEVRYNDLKVDLYDDTEVTGNLKAEYAYAGANLHSIFWDRFAIGVGARIEYMSLSNVVSSNPLVYKQSLWYSVYRGFIKLDTRDDIYFPSKGFNIDGEAQFITEDGFSYHAEMPPLVTKLSFMQVWSPTSKLTHILYAYGRIAFGDALPEYYITRVGGAEQFNYFSMSIPFIGLRYSELPVRNALVGRMDLRYNFYKKHYLTAKANVGLVGDEIIGLEDDGRWIFGGGLSYSTNTFIGPVEVNLMYSDYVNKPTSFISLGFWF